jgi:signal transduction histidine kinase
LRTFLFLIILFIASFSEAKNLDTFFSLIKENEIIKASKFAKDDILLKKYADILYYSGNKDSIFFNAKYATKLTNEEAFVVENLLKGQFSFIYKADNLNAFNFYYKALEKAEEIKNKSLIKISLINILEIYRLEIFFGNIQYERFLKKFTDLQSDELDNFLIAYYNLVFYSKTIFELNPKYHEYTQKLSEIFNRNNFNKNIKALYYTEKGLENRINNNIDKAINAYTKVLNILPSTHFNKSKKNSAHLNLAELYLNKNNFKLSKIHFIKAKKFFNKSKLDYDHFYYDRYISKYFKKLGIYDSAFYHLNKSVNIEYRLNYKANSLEISQLSKLYQTAEKDKENYQLSADKEKTKIFLIVSLLVIFLGGIIGILLLKNSKRKRKLAEKDKEIQTQKNLSFLKEQEITTINAMIDGQEKERTQIAEDLHDNLGSILATLKLHFENLKINHDKKIVQQDALFDKTEGLIDQAYLKVRSIAHAKNAGVIADQGLLVAIKIMSEKISSADKIKIEVIDYGLHKRLDNSLEISLFRTIQELITNIIKHAEAKLVTINIALFDTSLNIIVEDDGKGFDASKINFKKGMGISSIKTRMKHLKGTFEIDSTLGKGTSIIINIPVE